MFHPVGGNEPSLTAQQLRSGPEGLMGNWWRSYMAKQTADGGWISPQKKTYSYITGWWFQTFLIFIPILGRFPFWLIFFKGDWNHQLVIYCRASVAPLLTPIERCLSPHGLFCDQAKRVLVMANFNVTLAGNKRTKKQHEPIKIRFKKDGGRHDVNHEVLI